MKKRLLLSIVVILLSIGVSTFSPIGVGESFLNTIYTVAGIMFSIGMGVICTFNPDRIKNNSYLSEIRRNISTIRSSYIHYFTISSTSFLASQIFPNLRQPWLIRDYQIVFDLPTTVLVINLLGIIYYISNFLAIQKLNFQITDRINSEG